jgi:hypothetical protein
MDKSSYGRRYEEEPNRYTSITSGYGTVTDARVLKAVNLLTKKIDELLGDPVASQDFVDRNAVAELTRLISGFDMPHLKASDIAVAIVEQYSLRRRATKQEGTTGP